MARTVLFSEPKIAAYINANFEPAWQSVRPVPTVTVNFGDGHVITKTFRGNIATYICTPEGLVFDVLPGLYDSDTYLKRLQELHDRLSTFPDGCRSARAFTWYHSAAAQSEAKGQNVDALEAMLAQSHSTSNVMREPSEESLKQDSAANESVRRALIHKKLAATGFITPPQLTDWLYKEVLHVDLKDPYLGTKELLLSNDLPSPN